MQQIRRLFALPFRILGYAFVILAVLAAVRDIYRTVLAGEAGQTPLGQLWFTYSAHTLNVAQAGIQRGIHPAVWDPGMTFFLQLPAWLSLFLFALMALLIATLIYRPR